MIFPGLSLTVSGEGFGDPKSIKWASYRDLTDSGFSQKFKSMKKQGYRLHNFEGYKKGSKTYYSGIWINKPDNRNWSFWRDRYHKLEGPCAAWWPPEAQLKYSSSSLS
ncbi:MAG: hypothetical protein GY940_39835 [bacterium]|nr:hypothetical protein [bacterium]